MSKKLITYTYRGGIERGADYHWCDGYSETTPDGGILYPWMTRRECQADAKRQGGQAVFYTPPGPGAKRFEPEIAESPCAGCGKTPQTCTCKAVQP